MPPVTATFTATVTATGALRSSLIPAHHQARICAELSHAERHRLAKPRGDVIAPLPDGARKQEDRI
jgi:hypothetical protein